MLQVYQGLPHSHNHLAEVRVLRQLRLRQVICFQQVPLSNNLPQTFLGVLHRGQCKVKQGTRGCTWGISRFLYQSSTCVGMTQGNRLTEVVQELGIAPLYVNLLVGNCTRLSSNSLLLFLVEVCRRPTSILVSSLAWSSPRNGRPAIHAQWLL